MDALLTTPASLTALYAAGIFFMSGLLTGAWKYLEMMKSEQYRAPFYVDVAHRASLLYSFAALLVAIFAYYCSQSDVNQTVTLIATVAPLVFFGLSIALYIVLGLKNETNNQLRDDKAPGLTVWFMRGLMLGEIGGFGILFYGFYQYASQLA